MRYVIMNEIFRKAREMKTKPISAFTLAEILITLAIIGVLAAITIPSLMNNIQDNEMKVAWKENYSALSRAMHQLAQDNGGSLADLYNYDENKLRNDLTEYMIMTKKCDQNTVTGVDGCWHSSTEWKTLSPNRSINWPTSNLSDRSRAILNNGTLVVFDILSDSCSYTGQIPANDTCGHLFVDVNGYKKPNTIGKDIFGAQFVKNGRLIPFGTLNDVWTNQAASYSCNLSSYPNSEGWSCSAEYLK